LQKCFCGSSCTEAKAEATGLPDESLGGWGGGKNEKKRVVKKRKDWIADNFLAS